MSSLTISGNNIKTHIFFYIKGFNDNLQNLIWKDYTTFQSCMKCNSTHNNIIVHIIEVPMYDLMRQSRLFVTIPIDDFESSLKIRII